MSTLDCSGPVAPCNCNSNQQCVQVGRSSTECAKNICVDNGKSSGGSNIGATVGQALGGVIGALLLLFLVWYLRWGRKRGNPFARAVHRKRTKQLQLANKAATPRGAGSSPREKREKLSVGPGEEDADEVLVVHKRGSMRLVAGNDGQLEIIDGTLHKRSNSSPQGTASDNPFADHHSSNGRPHSSAASEFSMRTASTNIIPIAYIPPHSASISIHDGQGVKQSKQPSPISDRSPHLSLPFSTHSRNSLAESPSLSQSELEVYTQPHKTLQPLTPTFTKGGNPIRPPRAPGLDLKLPESTGLLTSPPHSPSFPVVTETPPPESEPENLNSRFSTSTVASDMTRKSEFLVPEGMPPVPKIPGQDDRYSTASGTSEGSSHLSYILDNPQIVTPVSAGRVEVVGRQQARAVLLPGHPAVPNSSPLRNDTTVADPFADPADQRVSMAPSIAPSNGVPSMVLSGSALSASRAGTPDSHRTSLAPSDARSSQAIESLSDGQVTPKTHKNSYFASQQEQLNDASRVSGLSEYSIFTPSTIPGKPSPSVINSFPPPPASRVQSTITNGGASRINSVQSTFSALEGIPFQLGFPSGVGTASDRGSVVTVHSNAATGHPTPNTAASRQSTANSVYSDVGTQRGVSTYSLASEWADQFQIGKPGQGGVPELPQKGSRQSTDSLSSAAELARQFAE